MCICNDCKANETNFTGQSLNAMDNNAYLRILVVVALVTCFLLMIISREWIKNNVSLYIMNRHIPSIFRIKYYNATSQNVSSYKSHFVHQQNITQMSTTSRFVSSDHESWIFSSTTTSMSKITTTPETHHICAVFASRLGNNMFQFASLYGIAKLRNMSLIVGSKALVRHIFQIDKSISTDTGPCRSAYTIKERWSAAFDNKLLKFDNKHDYKIKQYLESWKYFKHVEDDIRRQFRFNENISVIATNIVKRLIKKYKQSRSNVTLVGIHVRRGDYVNSRKKVMIATKEYLEKAMEYYRVKFKNVIFILCSNGIKWCKRNLQEQNGIEFMENNRREIDMAILASCDHVIQTVGTFSWWAAWLAGGTSIFYKWPARNGTSYRKKFSSDYKDFFYPGWIGM